MHIKTNDARKIAKTEKIGTCNICVLHIGMHFSTLVTLSKYPSIFT